MIRKAMLATLVFAVALVALPAIAGAHTEITADGKVGADGTIATKIAAEEECTGSSTHVLELRFPSAPALDTATAAPTPGWTAQVDKDPATNAVTKVTWTGAPPAGAKNFTFALTLGTIPTATDSITFKALQTCVNGDVFRWVQPVVAGATEPDFPTPVLDVSGKPAATDTSSTTKVPVTTTKKSSHDSNTGLIVGIVVAAVVVLGGGAALFARSKKN